MTCPHCAATKRQYKIGTNDSGSQRYLCDNCHRKYTPQPTHHGYDATVRHHALQLYVEGTNLRRIGRLLGISHQTVSNWVTAHAQTLPDAPPSPASPQVVHELDELYTCVASKKTVSMSSPKSTVPPAVSSAGRWRRIASGLPCKTWWRLRLPLSSTIRTASPCIRRWCTYRDRTKHYRTKVRPTLLKPIMPNCAIIWHAWGDGRAVSHGHWKHCALPSSCLSLPGIVGS